MAFKSVLVLVGCIVLCATQPTRPEYPVMKTVLPEVVFKALLPVILPCYINDGPRDVKYWWHKNGEPYSLTGDIEQRKGEGSITFLKPTSSDEGLYQCFAETSMGVATATPISFKLAYINPVQKPKVQEHRPVEGRPFQLECTPPEGYPKPVVTWKTQKDGSDVRESYFNRRAHAPEGTLYFSNATEDDVKPTTKLLCVAHTLAHDEEVVLAEHYIKGLEKDTKPNDGELVLQYVSKDIMGHATNDTAIWCIYGGTPLAYPNWFKDGKDVNGKPGDRVTKYNLTSGRRLLIKETIEEDEGTYKCVADNGVGKPQEHTIKVTVVRAPSYVVNPYPGVIVREGANEYIPCVAIGNPKPNVTYTYNGKPLETNERVSANDAGIIIKDLRKSDTGYYGCRAVNDYGEYYAESLFLVQ